MRASATQVIDVSVLPESALDHRSTIWWGNLLLLIIETTMFALLIASYFYLRGNFHAWPPPYTTGPVANLDPVPQLKWPLVNLAVILVSLAPMWWADRAALRMDCRGVSIALVLTIILGVAAILLRFREFSALYFRWDDNAYAGVTWSILGLHLTHLIVGTCENFIMVLWIAVHGMDKKHARDVRVTGVYWYWIVGIWVLLFAIVIVGPRYF